MELNPQAVAAATFSTVRKGYDPGEVREFLGKVSSSLEAARQQATAMEARARAAIAKMQELAQQQPSATVAFGPTPQSMQREIVVGPDESETISRTLLLAQRTADLTVADAQADAERIACEAETVIDEARASAATMIEAARTEARQSKEDEITSADEQVQSLLARRDFLLSDVEHLELYVGAQRERLRDAANALHDLIERVPGGLGEMRRPLLSASAEVPVDAQLSGETVAGAVVGGALSGDESSELLRANGASAADSASAEGPSADAQPDQAPSDELSEIDVSPLDLAVDESSAVRSDAFGSNRSAMRVDLAKGWRAADRSTESTVKPPIGVDDTQEVDVTPVEGQLRLGTDDEVITSESPE